jgi:hypothetical protein
MIRVRASVEFGLTSMIIFRLAMRPPRWPQLETEASEPYSIQFSLPYLPFVIISLAHAHFPYADWHCFPIFLINLLKGNLKRTSTITQPFFVATSHFANADALGPFIEGFFALTTHTAPAFDGWGRRDSYCAACLMRFLVVRANSI